MNRIKALRDEANLSLRELGKLTGITHSTVSWLETEKQPLRQHHIERLCAFFNCTTDFLLGKSDTGIGVFFKDDFMYVNIRQYQELNKKYECEVSIIETDLPNSTFKVWNKEVVLSKKQVYRFIKADSKDFEDVRSQLNAILDSLSENDLSKVLKFINDYIK